MNERTETAKVPVGESVAYSYGFMARHWAELAPACLLMAAFGGVRAVAPLDNSAATFLLGLLSIVAGTVYAAAVLRKAVHDERSGPFGLALGADEMRLVLAGLLVGLAVMPVFLVAFTALAFVAAADGADAFQAMLADPQALADTLRAKLGPGGSMGFMLFLLACMAAAVWIWVRLFLAQAATIGERALVVFPTWPWTRGDFWRVLAAILMTSVPAFVIGGIVVQIAGTAPAGVITILMAAGEGFISAVLGIPALALAAYLYKGLRPPGFKAS